MNKIRYIGKVKVINDEYVLKNEEKKDYLYNYLTSRDFNYFPPLIDRIDEYNKYPYYKDYSMDKHQKGEDIANILAELHNKTSYQKTVNQDKYEKIYNDLIGYINYVNQYYLSLFNEIELRSFPSPSELLYLTNYSKIKELIKFLKEETKKWYMLVKNKDQERIVLNHGNISLDHLIKNDYKYLISWDSYHFDTPINDLIKFYQNNWEDLDFRNILNIYNKQVKLTKEEEKLLIINICIPKLIKLDDIEYINTINVTKLFNYIYQTEDLIRPYYSEENTEK